MQADSYKFIPNGTPSIQPPPPDPYLIAREAIGRLQVPDPVVHFGPDDQKIAVQLATWLWVDDPGARSVTVTAGTVSVTATATLASTRWTMGEPKKIDAPALLADPVDCQGSGTPAPDPPPRTPPPGDCAYTYHWRSLPERTGGTGTWPVGVTATWAIGWTANTGQHGTDTLTATATSAARVGQYRNILVYGTGG